VRHRFCIDFLLPPALELAADATPTVRLRAAALLPALKRAVRLPDDVAALERLNGALAMLQARPQPACHATRRRQCPRSVRSCLSTAPASRNMQRSVYDRMIVESDTTR